MLYWITELPLPPSVNQYLMPVKSRLVKTDIHRDYDLQFTIWAMRNQGTILRVKELTANYIKQGLVIQIDMFFCFQKSRIFTSLGQVQELDRDNRIKPATDQMHKILGIDDRYIFAGNSEKVTTERKDEECLIIRISTMKPRSKKEVLNQMLSEYSLQGKER